jgi:hypothetical protein
MVSKTMNDGGAWSSKYEFNGIDDTYGSPCYDNRQKCKGWTLNGDYGTTTDALGESKVYVEARVSQPNKFNKFSMFGVGMAFEYG